jgi:hypothetical protein
MEQVNLLFEDFMIGLNKRGGIREQKFLPKDHRAALLKPGDGTNAVDLCDNLQE